jgi:Bacterial Ig-like domain
VRTFTFSRKRAKPMKYVMIPTLLFLVILLSAAQCNQEKAPVAKATINSFTAAPPSLPAGGGSVTLNWDVKDATKLSLDQSIGEVTGGSKTVSVTSSKTFTLTAESAGGSVTKTAEVTVQAGADITPPTVVSVSPENGAKGVTSDATIVITFSETMERVSTQASYQSAALPAGGVTFSWNDESTILTIKPNTPLIYAAGDKPATLVAKSYNFSLTNTAKDVSGNALSEVSSSFSTLRQVYVEVPSQPTLNGTVSSNGDLGLGSSTGIINVGDDANKTGARGFVSFDLSAIQSGASIKDAQLRLNKLNVINAPYELLDCTPTQIQFCPAFAPLNLEHISYGPSLEAADYNAGFLGELGFFDTMSTPLGHVKKDVTAAVSDDLSNRDARGSRSQYRLLFSLQTNKDAKANYVTFNGSNGDLQKAPYLFINYLIP